MNPNKIMISALGSIEFYKISSSSMVFSNANNTISHRLKKNYSDLEFMMPEERIKRVPLLYIGANHMVSENYEYAGGG